MAQSYKHYISANELLQLSYKLAKQVADSDFKPNWLVALWRGGAPIGIAIQEFLEYKGITTDHIAIRTSSYKKCIQGDTINVHNLHYIVENANVNDRLLIVDDIFDTGKSIEAVVGELKSKMRANLPTIKIATIYWKHENNKTQLKPDYYCELSNKWIVFPHELENMSIEEIEATKGKDIADFLK